MRHTTNRYLSRLDYSRRGLIVSVVALVVLVSCVGKPDPPTERGSVKREYTVRLIDDFFFEQHYVFLLSAGTDDSLYWVMSSKGDSISTSEGCGRMVMLDVGQNYKLELAISGSYPDLAFHGFSDYSIDSNIAYSLDEEGDSSIVFIRNREWQVPVYTCPNIRGLMLCIDDTY